MKLFYSLGVLVLILLSVSCNSTDQSSSTLKPIDDMVSIFKEKTAKYDSVSVEETDSTYTFYVIPDTTVSDTERELFGAFTINKESPKIGDVNDDGLDDAVIQYTYTPHLENNTLIYYKLLVQSNGKLEETGEIFGGGRCEGPVLSVKEIKRGNIYFEGADYASGDPCCCPSIIKEHIYKFEDNKVHKLDTK